MFVCSRRNTVNAHGGKAGFHNVLYAKACEKIMAKVGWDEGYMALANNLFQSTVIVKDARGISGDKFLAVFFFLMPNDKCNTILKVKLDNDYLF